MKTRSKLFLLSALFVLTGCKAVNETFKLGEFHTGEFRDNYYTHMPHIYSTGSYEETIYDLSDKVRYDEPFSNIFNSIILDDIRLGAISNEEAVKYYGSDTAKAMKQSDYGSYDAFILAQWEEMARSSNLQASWFNYAKYHSLSTGYYGDHVAESFKRGIFSKLTDTLVFCDGTGSLVRVQINEAGIGQVFDHELISYRNFAFALRGGTNIDFAKLGLDRVNRARVLLNISFYIEKSTTDTAKKVTLTLDVPNLHVDDNSVTTIINMDLSKLLPANALKRVSGMSVNFELLEHDLLMPGGVKDENFDGEFALMLYEVMFPYSVWR